ncbi:hypothetical protein [Paenibacillus sp. S02]|uniref:hypothetical protein n=1 Tax=Paenibacillus sp. S02 TaxID=2823904 RepID=UPI0021ABA229|nr:hypothetical protein [Paenibacillus sp. S02]QYK66129.1 hypothetical protein KAI36_01265 [Paenibacillus sp. S02]
MSELWIKHYSKHGKPKAEGTIRIRNNERDNLLIHLAKRKSLDVTPEEYQNALQKLKDGDEEKDGLAKNTLSGVHTTGRIIFKYGIKIGAVKNDPTADAYVPQDVATVEELENKDEIPLNILKKMELIHFLDTAQKHGLDNDYETFRTLACTGIRVGELCALKKMMLISKSTKFV